MKLLKRATAATALALSLLTLGAGTATAGPGFPPDGDALTLHSLEACARPGVSKFVVHVYWGTKFEGAYANLWYPVSNFEALRPGDSHSYPLRFCIINGASAPWPGSGMRVKNAAGSVWNNSGSYKAYFYTLSLYKGDRAMIPQKSISERLSIYKDNASFQLI